MSNENSVTADSPKEHLEIKNWFKKRCLTEQISIDKCEGSRYKLSSLGMVEKCQTLHFDLANGGCSLESSNWLAIRYLISFFLILFFGAGFLGIAYLNAVDKYNKDKLKRFAELTFIEMKELGYLEV